MQKKKPSRALHLIMLAAFWLAAVINLWKVLEKGPAPAILVPAVCFTIGGVILLLRLVRAGDAV